VTKSQRFWYKLLAKKTPQTFIMTHQLSTSADQIFDRIVEFGGVKS